MAYKDILVHLDNSTRSDVRLKIAVELAKQHGAFLTGVYAFEVLSPALYMGDASVFDIGLADEIMSRARQRAIEIGTAVAGCFRAQLRDSDVAGEWREIEGQPAETIAACARYTDLVIVGAVDPDQPKSFAGSDVPVTAILQSGRPVLVIPYAGRIESVGMRVIIGWKAGREAARAVTDALPVLSTARSVRVLAIAPADDIADGEKVASALVRYLAHHGVAATATHALAGDVPDGDILLNDASDTGADLIVVGGYGHSRATEFILGGVTRTLLTSMTVPVLFSH